MQQRPTPAQIAAHMATSTDEPRLPEDVAPGDDHWTEHKLDLLKALESLQAWERFQRKWWRWHDAPVAMSQGKLDRWNSELWGELNLQTPSTDREFNAIQRPQVLLSTELARKASLKPGHAPPDWGTTFQVLGNMEFFLIDDEGRVFLDESKLQPGSGEARSGARPVILDSLGRTPQ